MFDRKISAKDLGQCMGLITQTGGGLAAHTIVRFGFAHFTQSSTSSMFLFVVNEEYTDTQVSEDIAEIARTTSIRPCDAEARRDQAYDLLISRVGYQELAGTGLIRGIPLIRPPFPSVESNKAVPDYKETFTILDFREN